MKKTILKEWNKVYVEDAPIPEPGDEEALIKLLYGSICGTDIHVYSHRHSTATLPRVLGHEYCGELVSINTNKNTDIKPGDYVTSHPINSCGHCDSCLLGRENVCSDLEIYGIHVDGCFVEYFVVPVDKLYKIDKQVNLMAAVQIEPLAVAIHDVSMSKLERGQSVFIVSAGPIGMLIAIIARQSGASKIVLSEINEYRIELARSLGFTTFNPAEVDFEEKLLAETEGKGFDVIYEVSGSKAGTELMTRIAAQRASIVIVGVPEEKYPVDTGAVLAKEIKIIGVRIHPRYVFKRAVDMVNSGIVNEDLQNLVTNVFPLKDINEAISYNLNDKNHFKILLQP